MRQTAREAGRDPDAIEITVSAPDDLATIPELARAGIRRVTIPVMANAGLAKRISGPEDVLAFREMIERYRG